MKKLMNVLCILTFTSIVSAGCGTNEAATSTAAVTNGTTAATATTAAPKKYEINLATAGDTNMTDLQEKNVSLDFQKQYAGSQVRVVNTGAGDAGTQKIFEKLKAQKEAGKTEWDIDLAIVHQSGMQQLIDNDLLDKWVPQSANKQYVVSPDSKNSLGTNVEGYVIPLFHSQVALAYNPDKVKQFPANIEDLTTWIKANPKRFGYNGIQNGASGVAFATAYTYWKSGDYKKLSEGPFDASLEQKWPAIMKELKALPVTYTNGNNGTLDMLNRGEIDMGPVWVDMFNLWVSEGRMNPAYGLKILDPGIPGQPMYVVIPKNAKNKEAALKYADLLTSPETQAKVIVEKNSWYPGIDATAVLPKVSEEGKKKLFKDITAEDLNKRGQSFPINTYFDHLKTAYEKN
ncbi:ABC transporter substrate-binding protein [Paenibacillus marchantiophytorum]|uniref:ABC transporter substrate-binding protein n=1 Tax=Paenibacillus marchantiophytorum TaxID=1619310 RepID=A0ABQ1FEP6_9BACL|nr:extracellular solute-binding protein [Paenibacillus marchantiophytorum]GGA09631.1 ABC transporter substrate-binding protein [Paenibacillus marchantiophytorum]